jgi:hypothetical protein
LVSAEGEKSLGYWFHDKYKGYRIPRRVREMFSDN